MNLTSTAHDGYCVIAVDGRLVASSAAAFRDAVKREVEAGRTRIAVDLSAASFVDSSGLGALIAGLKTARVAGGDLRIASVPQAVRTVLGLTNLDRVLRAHESPETAFDGS